MNLLFFSKAEIDREKKKNKSAVNWGRSQDGGGVGRRDHFLFYKFIERTTER